MLRAHSLLWHYLWIAPNLLLLALGFLLRRSHFQKKFPLFVIFAFVVGLEQLATYMADVLPWVTPLDYWRILWIAMLIEALIKFALIGEIFSKVFGPYSSLANLGKVLITAVGVALVFTAALAAAYTPKNNIHWIVSGLHILDQTIYLIECGLVLFLFLFAAYFKLQWDRAAFGIALGLGISAAVHMATWAIMANGGLVGANSTYLVFLNMATYHACVLIWFYYLLVPQKRAVTAAIPEPGHHNLELWNRELERLLQQ